MRANLSQVSRATTGQVASDEPRPISTSRQPVLPRRRNQHALVENFDPAAAILGLVAAAIEADDLGAAQAAGEAEQQHGAVAQAAQRAAVERFQHGDEILGQHRLLLPGRGGVLVADAGHDGGDMAVLPIERLAALRIVPGQRRQPAFDRRHRIGLLVAGRRSRGAGGDVEADDLRIGRKQLDALASAPVRKMLPVGGVGATGVGRTRRLDIVARAVGEVLQMRPQSRIDSSRNRRGGDFRRRLLRHLCPSP